ncbi:RDD family protein [Paraherbaspirillum soli]|uniref:RDD family protein n=1 Tax=Paraherbaspirillum soli TaxID=631222 RepID=A0ABW0M5A1_9BURK
MMNSDQSAELEYVGFWLRVGASLIDTIVLMVVLFPLTFAIYGRANPEFDFLAAWSSDYFLAYALPALFYIAFWSKKQATPGKMAISATIVDDKTGGPPTLTQYIVRYLGYIVATIPFGLGLVWVGFDKKKQGWHDKMAGTVVVRPRNSGTEAVRFGP